MMRAQRATGAVGARASHPDLNLPEHDEQRVPAPLGPGPLPDVCPSVFSHHSHFQLPPSHRRQPSRPLASPVLESPPSQADIASIAASINRRGSAAIVEELKSTMTATLPRSSLAEFETDADGSQPGDRDADLSNEVTKESPFARTDRPIPAAVAGDRNERPIGAAAKANNAAFANVRKLPSPMSSY